MNDEYWQVAEQLISSDRAERDLALEVLSNLQGAADSPLLISLLLSATADPELEVRYRAVMLLGRFLDGDESAAALSDRVLLHLQDRFLHLSSCHLIDLLEVSAAYLSAESAVLALLKLCSFAGKDLSGIVNDRKLPLSIRKQAVYYLGEAGFLDGIPTLSNLRRRVEKRRQISRRPGSPHQIAEEALDLPAEVALTKLST